MADWLITTQYDLWAVTFFKFTLYWIVIILSFNYYRLELSVHELSTLELADS